MIKQIIIVMLLLMPAVLAEDNICGNDDCERPESPLTCYADCDFNVDEIICVATEKECNSWVYWFYLLLILVWLIYRKK